MSSTVSQGTYVSGRRVLEYWTRCPVCLHLSRCTKARAPVEECEKPGSFYFHFDDGTGGVTWSGVLTLKKLADTVREYLECEEDDLPDDVAVPPRQLDFGELDL